MSYDGSSFSPVHRDFKNIEKYIIQIFMEAVNDVQKFLNLNGKLSEKYDH